ncbi:MAG: hypothetical protein CMG46_02685 [Candidatus Marinimicrobia bacterium]|nr:hypothetical protein [Candidatus Neomarinimicrobiota bacterium]|tara:strand:- start:932 stop:1213 length:282 start_codon:yes stop_codon:yes gene_type:complete
MEKALAPLTQVLKKNNKNISLVLLVLVLMFLFPLDHFLPYDIKNKVETELKVFMDNPWVKVFVSAVVMSVYFTRDLNMLVLTLYVIHHISLHK